MIKKNQQKRYELLVEDDTYQAGRQEETDLLDELPLLMQLESTTLQNALCQLSERERYVFLSRVLEETGFEELGAELGLGYKGAAAVYYRAAGKIKKLMKGDGRNEF